MKVNTVQKYIGSSSNRYHYDLSIKQFSVHITLVLWNTAYSTANSVA